MKIGSPLYKGLEPDGHQLRANQIQANEPGLISLLACEVVARCIGRKEHVSKDVLSYMKGGGGD